ncbi:ankyrin repeat and sterile alpha motif domain-containing protein 1B [Ixodes scapularis]|uniref:ankyrin repeat and sterile alpha motif domain-containing protein 1B n=1 Tax=Ixodes scapularis TaxID=6945 RepID=UPI001A9DEE3D|nr:ankyrin repeat and sterile alpha motif domain-containing protein 1B [Ixodes scapularis]
MGKEQELLDAARNGNLAVVERILSQRAKKTGPLASLRRGPGTNAHDQSGYTSLHHSALNGHPEIVALLLDHEASANVVDGQGSTPLHLAAWTGNTDVVRLLLERGPSLANANHSNQEQETALHFAAQYGHADAVALLLSHGAEPGLRNVRGESPLDLAAQYGRLESVSLLAGAQAHSLQRLATPHHSPLHLAARNGHRQVVRLLLDRGFPVNCRTDGGTALHEAATFGKLDVVRLLLDYGVDPDLRDAQGRRATDVLEELNTGIAKQARDMIRERAEADSGGSADASPRSISPPPAFASPAARQGLPRRNSAGLGSPDLLADMAAARHAKRPSLGDVARVSLRAHEERPGGPLVLSLSPGELAQVPPPACFQVRSDEDGHWAGSGYLPMASLQQPKPQPPAKPPRRSVAHSPGVYEQLCLSSSGRRRRLSSGDSRSPPAEYVDMRPNHDASSRLCELSSLYDQAASECLSGRQQHTRSASDTTGTSDERPGSLSLGAKRATVQIPLSPSHYAQPPTPEFPPPSPSTAESGIHDRIRPLSREYVVQRRRRLGSVGGSVDGGRRSSRDADTLTDEDPLLQLNGGDLAPAGSVEEIVEENPFAGLCRGSSKTEDPPTPAVEPGSKPRLGPKPAPPPRRRVPPVDTGTGNSHGDGETAVEPSRQQPSSPFDENAEWAEIADIMASFGSGIARESVFARDMEEEFARTLTRQKKQTAPTEDGLSSARPETIDQWLLELGLPEYANLLLVNGYDDVRFLGGGLVEDQDLLDMGVSNADHRRAMVESAAERLPRVPQLEPGSDPGLDAWLDSIGLACYAERFRENGFGSVDRCRLIWELELNTVLEISKLGHQKRILASLGERAPNRFADLDDLDLGLSKLNMGLRELGVEEEDRPPPCALRIRPPTQLMSDPGRSPAPLGGGAPPAAQWRHDPELLVHGCCDYTAQYLGSTLVKELQGTESTRQSIHKLKASTRNIGKIPSVLLSVSHRGVKFVDAVTKRPVCEHEIRNIHCACQDADDLTHFAYITKEHQTNHHYCHVFCAQTMELATEIILTLGQAFEVAYQLALRDRGGLQEAPRAPPASSQRT